MGGLPPGVFVLMVALLSAFAGALLTWVIMAFTGGRQGDAVPSPPQEEGTPTEDLLRVVQTKRGPAVFVRGKRRRHLREIEDRETGEEAIAAIKAVLAFAEGWLPALQQRPDAPSPTDERPSGEAAELPASVPQEPRVGMRGTSSALPSDPLKIVEEIDALVQQRLEKRPDLARRGIRLTRDVRGNLLIYVGQQRYRSADDIPDDEVGSFIRETIRMWENR